MPPREPHVNPPESFLPDFCSLDTTLILVMSSLVLGLVLTLADFSSARTIVADFGLRSFFVVWVVLLSGGSLCLLRAPLTRLSPIRGALASFLVVQCLTMVLTLAAQVAFDRLGYRLTEGYTRLEVTLRILAISSLATGIWLRYQFVLARWRQQNRAEALARLDALQTRMRPHFLFNGLNAIAGMMREDTARAEELLLDLADMFRAVLRQNTSLVPVAEEIILTRHYLRIEQLRLGDRLEVTWDVEQVPQNALIPPLSLQPLVENAIRHGVERADHGGQVAISGRITRHGLVITVSNTLPDTVGGGDDRAGSGQALTNLRSRLEVCFPGQARLHTSLAEGRHHIHMVIPYPPGAP